MCECFPSFEVVFNCIIYHRRKYVMASFDTECNVAQNLLLLEGGVQRTVENYPHKIGYDFSC